MQHINLDEKWCFRRGMLDSVGMLQWDPGELVNLPHDGMIHLDVTKEAPAQYDSGYYPGDTCNYTRYVMIPREWERDLVGLQFDGVMMHTSIDVNGCKVGEHHYGYSPFYVDLTDYVTFGATAQGPEADITAHLQYSTKDGSFINVGKAKGDTATQSAITFEFKQDKLPSFENITADFSATSNQNKNGSSTFVGSKGGSKSIGSGRKVGEMSGIAIWKDGKIYASYDNGQKRLLGQIAVANFANASGLSKEGDNLYSATQNSGDFNGVGEDITADGGYMNSGVLEMSNVDLSAEFTEMITTQRGFQANSRIITVSDTLLEELTNLKR